MDDNAWGCVLYFVALIVLIAGIWVLKQRHFIGVSDAVGRFAEMADVPEDSIHVVRHSNDRFLVGDPMDVTYELEIAGERVSGRCTSGMFSPMVCRLYED